MSDALPMAGAPLGTVKPFPPEIRGQRVLAVGFVKLILTSNFIIMA
jgi:hypothetical protein